MFTYHVTQHLSFTFMGYSTGGRNGSGYQSTEEIIRYKNHVGGKLELVHFNSTGEDIPGSAVKTSSFNHLVIVVEDIQATQKRLEEFGVTILKRAQEPLPTEGYFANPFSLGDASNLSSEDFAAIHEGMSRSAWLNIYCADPDGNMIGVIPVDEGDIFG